MVSKPTGQVPQEGEHEEGAGSAGPQCPPADLLRRAVDPGGDGAQGTGTARQEAPQTAG